jgi:hypothetical protein
VTERRTWILRHDTKGTGAEIRPLDAEQFKAGHDPPLHVHPNVSMREPKKEKPVVREPPRFRATSIFGAAWEPIHGVTVNVLVDWLATVPRMGDWNLWLWSPEQDRWIPLPAADRKFLWKVAKSKRG